METLRDGSKVTLRAIRPADVELERRFIEQLSPESRHHRFLGAISQPSDALLRQLTDIDPQQDAALIALVDEEQGGRAVGVARFSAAGRGRAELAITVSDDWRHRGLATLLINRLVDVARARGIRELYSTDSGSNAPMRELAASMGFTRRVDPLDATQVIYTLALASPAG